MIDMRISALLLVLGFTLMLNASGSAIARDVAASATAEMDVAIGQADDLLEALRFDDAVATLTPFAEAADPRVHETLARAQLFRAIEGKQPDEIDRAEIDSVIMRAEYAAGLGSPAAMNLLYLIHANGYGRPPDLDRALAHLEQAAAAGDDGARVNLAASLYLGNAMIARDLDRACELFIDLAKREVMLELVSYYMGLIIFKGECGREPDRIGGMSLIEIAANHDVRDAQRDMGKNHELGWTGEPDQAAALKWYERAAANGDAYSHWRIGMAYVSGDGYQADPVRAVEHFRSAAANDHPMGLSSLAVMYATGDGVPRDYAEALKLYARAAELGESHAYRALAIMHMRGEGIAVDRVKARVLYLQSLALGSAELPALRSELEGQMSADEVEQSDRRFAAWRGSQ
jgi:hypothetical protein